MKKIILALSILLIASPNFASAKSKTALETVESFYKEYMPLTALRGKKPSLTFSKSLKKLDKREAALCKDADGLCGWNAGGDPYLNAQESEPKLTFEKAGGTVTEEEPGRVRVKMNVYPSLPENKAHYERDILFVMKKERGKWVVDDIIYSPEDSARGRMNREIESMLKLKTLKK